MEQTCIQNTIPASQVSELMRQYSILGVMLPNIGMYFPPKTRMSGPSLREEIALLVGFQTQAHFTAVFRRFVGDTPHKWRCVNRFQN
jgi:hypothetical protein